MDNSLFNIIEWNELRKILKLKYSIDYIKLDNLYDTNAIWIKYEELDRISDLNILLELKKIHEMNGLLYIITDVSYRKDLGPFVVESNNINEFAKKHNEFFGERFWDTDTIIISFEKNLIWFVQHDSYLGLCIK